MNESSTAHGTSWHFRMFYDGACPLCMREVRFLRKRDKEQKISFIDTSDPEFKAQSFGLPEDRGVQIHGALPDGRVVKGLEVFRNAYRQVGLGWILAPTGWPVLRPLFDLLYLMFAKNRARIGRILGKNCESENCGV